MTLTAYSLLPQKVKNLRRLPNQHLGRKIQLFFWQGRRQKYSPEFTETPVLMKNAFFSGQGPGIARGLDPFRWGRVPPPRSPTPSLQPSLLDPPLRASELQPDLRHCTAVAMDLASAESMWRCADLHKLLTCWLNDSQLSNVTPRLTHWHTDVMNADGVALSNIIGLR